MADNKIEIEVALNTEKIEKDWSRLAKTSGNEAEKASTQGQKSFKDTEKQSQNSSKKVGEHWKAASGIAKNALKSGMGGAKKVIRKTAQILVDAGTAAVKTGITFENAFAGVKKTVNASDKELEQLRKGILDMSKEMPESASEIAAVAEEAGKLGIKSNGILGFTKSMIQLGDSTSLSTEEAAASLSKLADITQMPQTDFSRLGSTVVALSGQLDTSEKKITDMAVQIAGAGHEAGMSETEILSFAGILSSAGQEAEAGSIAFSQLTSKMSQAAASGGNDLNEFARISGTSSEQFKKAFQEDAAGAVGSFLQGLDQINQNGGNTVKTLENLGLSDIQVQDTLLKAAEASGTFTETLAAGNQAWSDNTALQDKAGQQYETTENKISTLSNKFSQLGISIFDNVNNPIREAIDVISGYVDQLQEVFDKKGLEGLAGELGSIFANLAEDVAKQAPALIKTASQVVKAFISGLVKNGPKIQSAAKSLVKSLAGGIADVLPKEMGTAFRNLSNILIQVADKGITVLAKSLDLISKNFSTILPIVTGVAAAFKTFAIVTAIAGKIKALNTALTIYNAAQIVCAANGVVCNATLTVGQAIFGLLTGQVTLATAATNIFNAATKALAGPIGWIALAIGAVAAGVAAYSMSMPKATTEADKFGKTCEKVKKQQDDMATSIKELHKENEKTVESTKTQGVEADNLFKQLKKLIKVEDKSAGTKARIKSVVEQLNELLPDLGLKYDAEKDKLNKSTEAIKNNIEALKEQAMAKAYQAGMEKSAKKVAEAEVEQEKAINNQTEALQRRDAAQEKFNKLKDKYGLGSGNQELADAGAALDKYNQDLEDADAAVDKSKKNMESAYGELDTYTNKFTAQTNFNDFKKNLDDLAKEAGIKASKIPKSVGEGIKAGIYANPTSGKELKQLMKLDDLVNSEDLAKMQEAGMKIPQYLAQGMADGSISFKTAAQHLENGINWTDMIEKARAKGIEVPNSIAEGIQSGQYAVPTSVDAVANLVTFEDLQAKARNGGVQVPESLANAITSGSMKPKEATAALSNLVDFQNAIDKAGIQGTQVPTELAQKIVDGKISVDDALKQMMSGQGVSVETFGVSKVIDNVAKSTGDSTKQIETNMKVKAVDNSGAASSSFKPFKTESSKAVSETKKSTDAIHKNSKIPATNNSGAGKKTVSSYTNELGKGVGKAKSATTKVTNAAVSGFLGGASKAKAAGAKLGSAYVSGISSKNGQATAKGKELSAKTASGVIANKGKIKTAAQNAVNGAKKVSTSGFNNVGKNIASGIAKGINKNSSIVSSAAARVVRNAKDAANKEADSHSPSRVFRDQVGKYLPLGMAAGIRENSGEVVKASRDMSKASLDAAAAELEIHSPSIKFDKIVGRNIPKGIAKGIKKEQKSVISATKSMIASLEKAAKNPFGKFEQTGTTFVDKFEETLNKKKDSSIKAIKKLVDDQVKALKKQNKSKSKDYTKAGKSIVSAYTKAITSETKKLVTKAEKEIEEISKKFQEDYDHIKSLQDGLEDKQKSYGNIYDLDQNIADIKQYQNNLKALENKIPDSMMEHILGMNIEDATEYMEWFRSLSAAEQKAYTDKWKQQESMSENFSKSFFADDISRLNKEYSKKINEATAGLEKQMKNIGKNIMRGMAKGMKSETKNLNKTIRDICNKVVKAAKKKLGVNSPSRVFAEIGKYNIQGAEQGQEKEAPKLYKQMEHVADTMAEKFAKAQMNIPRLQDKLQAAVARQSAKFMANVQPQIIYAGGGSDTTKIEKTVYTGPEKIELVTTLNGREIARGSAPFLNQEFEAIAKHQERGG